jgi:hypothetical protein
LHTIRHQTTHDKKCIHTYVGVEETPPTIFDVDALNNPPNILQVALVNPEMTGIRNAHIR